MVATDARDLGQSTQVSQHARQMNPVRHRGVVVAQVIVDMGGVQPVIDRGQPGRARGSGSRAGDVRLDLGGRIVAEGGPELAERIDANGYEQFAGAGAQ